MVEAATGRVRRRDVLALPLFTLGSVKASISLETTTTLAWKGIFGHHGELRTLNRHRMLKCWAVADCLPTCDI